MSKIVFLGDSITRGATLAVADTFAYQVGVANGYAPADIINAGVSGDESADALARVGTDAIALAPDVCVVCLLVNDAKNGVPVSTYEANMQQIISDLLANGIKPVLLSPCLRRGSQSVHEQMRPYLEVLGNLAGANGVPFVDVYREFSFAYLYLSSTAFTSLYADPIHPDKDGHAFMASIMTRPQYTGVFS